MGGKEQQEKHLSKISINLEIMQQNKLSSFFDFHLLFLYFMSKHSVYLELQKYRNF